MSIHRATKEEPSTYSEAEIAAANRRHDQTEKLKPSFMVLVPPGYNPTLPEPVLNRMIVAHHWPPKDS